MIHINFYHITMRAFFFPLFDSIFLYRYFKNNTISFFHNNFYVFNLNQSKYIKK